VDVIQEALGLWIVIFASVLLVVLSVLLGSVSSEF
jgi:hypothetical protein